MHTRCSVHMSSEQIRCLIWGPALRSREEWLGREEWRCAILLPWRGKGQKALLLESSELGSIILSEVILGVCVRRAIVLSSDHATHQPCPFGKSRILLTLGFLPGGLWTRAWVVRSTRKAVRRPHREGKVGGGHRLPHTLEPWDDPNSGTAELGHGPSRWSRLSDLDGASSRISGPHAESGQAGVGRLP